MSRRRAIHVTDGELRKLREPCKSPSCEGHAAQMVLSRASWKECTTCGHQWDFHDASNKVITREQKDELAKPRAGSQHGGEAEEQRAQGRRREQYKQEAQEMTKKKSNVEKAKAPKTKPKAKAKRERDSRVPKVGTVLKGKYKGKEFTAKVTAEGFEFNGKAFSSISKVGSVIMNGKACNGYAFFGLV